MVSMLLHVKPVCSSVITESRLASIKTHHRVWWSPLLKKICSVGCIDMDYNCITTTITGRNV